MIVGSCPKTCTASAIEVDTTARNAAQRLASGPTQSFDMRNTPTISTTIPVSCTMAKAASSPTTFDSSASSWWVPGG